MGIERKAYDRFMTRVCPEPNTGCWLWMGAYATNGYGAFSYGRQIGAHVFAYLTRNKDIPLGMVVHHVCNNKACVNPDHLECVTPSENSRLAAIDRYSTRYVSKKRQFLGNPTSHKQIIDLWPNLAELARDMGVDYQRARQWYLRGNVPSKYWSGLVEAARARGFSEVTLDLLASIKAAERKDVEVAEAQHPA